MLALFQRSNENVKHPIERSEKLFQLHLKVNRYLKLSRNRKYRSEKATANKRDEKIVLNVSDTKIRMIRKNIILIFFNSH